MLCLEYLEKLYYAVYMVQKTPTPIKINDLVGKYFSADTSTSDADEDDSPDEDEEGEDIKESVPEDELQWFYTRLNDIYSECRKVSRKVPLVELIKYFRNDIYYKLAFYIPRLKLKDFYSANLKIHLLEQVDDKYTKARNVLIEKNIKQVF